MTARPPSARPHRATRPAIAATLGAALLAAALGAAGCGGAEGGGGQPQADTAAQVFTVPFPPVAVRLDEAGADPRAVLAPTLTEGARQTVALTTRSEVHQQEDGTAEGDFSTPEVTLPLTAVVAATAGTGTGVDLSIARVSTPDPVLQVALDKAQGSSAALTATGTGAVAELRLRPAEPAPDIARSAIEQALYQAVYSMASFPSEPVGVGARWTLEQSINSRTEILQTTVVTLRSRSGDILDLGVEVRQRPREAVWQLDDDAGVLTIDSYEVSGTGSLTVDLALPLPVHGEVAVAGTQSYSDPDSPFTVRQRTAMRVQWAPR